MQFFKLLVAMTAMVAAQADNTKCAGDSTGTDPCCAFMSLSAGCTDSYEPKMNYAETCTQEESGSSLSYNKFDCMPEGQGGSDFSTDFYSDYDDAAAAAGTAIVTILLLWILLPVIICVCVCVCICACSKTCCFAPKQQAPVMVVAQ